MEAKTGYDKVDLASGLTFANNDITAISAIVFPAFDRAGQQERGAYSRTLEDVGGALERDGIEFVAKNANTWSIEYIGPQVVRRAGTAFRNSGVDQGRG